MTLRIGDLGSMTPAQEQSFLKDLDATLGNDDGSAARAHLAAGNPIYTAEDDTPEGMVIKHYPDGRRQLVHFEGDVEVVDRELGAQ